LFADQAGLANIRIAIPLAKEKLSEERVQRLLLATQFLASAAVLLAEGAQEPFQHGESSLFRIRFLSWGDEEGGVLGPVGGVFGQRGAGEDERRCS
jgi:hypothetical protein